MAQQTFAGVPAEFTPGEVLSSDDQNLLRNYLIAQIKEGMTGDTGEILPMIMDLTNNRIVLDSGGLEFSNGSTQTVAATAVGFSGTTANGMLTYSSASTIATQSTATYASNTLTLTGAGGGLKMNGLDSSDANTLDDYEEGVFTITCATSSGSATVNTSVDTVKYTKIGNRVFISGTIEFSAISSPSGSVNFSGLPFTNTNTGIESEARAWGLATAINTVSNVDPGATLGWVEKNAAVVTIYTAGLSAAASWDAGKIDTGTAFLFHGHYSTDS
jgi:hypothetical protein